MSQLHTPASLSPSPAVESASGASQTPALASQTTSSRTDGASTRRQVVMAKSAGERSFGMTLEPGRDMAEFPQVSYVFPNSIANRSGLRSGWAIERINGISLRGYSITDAANLFRTLQQVVLDLDTRTERTAPAMPTQVNGPATAAPPQRPRATLPMDPAATSLLSSAPSLSSLEPTAASTTSPPSINTNAGSSTTESSTRATDALAPSKISAIQRLEVPTAVDTNSIASLTQAAAIIVPTSDPQPSHTTTPLPVASHDKDAAQIVHQANATTANPPPAAADGQNRSERKRDRPDEAQADTHAPATSAPTGRDSQPHVGRRRGRQVRRRSNTPPVDMWNPEDTLVYYDSTGEIEVVSPQASSGSRRSSRQAESGGRARRSLTVSRLMTMGFTQEDAELSVEACGQDPEKCMVWIVSHLEEKQFMNDLNRASIESENQKRIEAQEQKKQESETLRQATAFTSLFQTSYILSSHAEAPRLKAMLSSTIGVVAADTLMRTLMTKLLTVESKAIRWYKEASRCYMLELAARLEAGYQSHDVITCCSRVMATEPAADACSFVRLLQEEEKELTKALFFLPENHGGVPLAFLRADESMHFSLDDDGFEVIDPVLPPTSPGHE